MSVEALQQTTEALQKRLQAATSLNQADFHIGAPVPKEMGGKAVSLFLYNIVPNRDLRNVERSAAPPPGAPAGAPTQQVDALPVDLRYLITVLREDPSRTEPTELLTLGRIIGDLHARPTLSGALLPGQTVRLTPEPTSIQELHDIWGLLPEATFRTSVVYLASPVFIELPPVVGSVVLERRLDGGVSASPGGGAA